jgi:hypothetical protein
MAEETFEQELEELEEEDEEEELTWEELAEAEEEANQ